MQVWLCFQQNGKFFLFQLVQLVIRGECERGTNRCYPPYKRADYPLGVTFIWPHSALWPVPDNENNAQALSSHNPRFDWVRCFWECIAADDQPEN